MSRLFASAGRIVVLSAIVVASIAASPGRAAAQTNLVGDGGFETPAISGGSTTINPGAGLAPWSVSGAPIKLNRSTSGAPEGSQWIDLTGQGGSISQSLATLPGGSYKLRFKYTTQIGSEPGVLVKWGPSGNPTFTETIHAEKEWATAERTLTATSATTLLSFTSAGGNNNFGVQLDAVSVTPLPLLAAPTLIRAISTGANTAFLIGRVDGAPNASITVQAATAASCTNGALAGGTPAGNGSTTTDANGYFGLSLSGISPDRFVTVQLTSPSSSAASQCLASAADNDSWPKALDISSASTPFSATGIIDEPGKTRWFKFNVAPGQRIQVTLSGLPADYDLAVFKDILQVFNSALALPNPAALTKVAAEYAPSAFTPSAFTPSAFTPSAFTPSAFTPSAFTPSAFTPSAFTPSAFTPSAFTASAFSPSAFTPSAFTPSAFTPSAFTPSAFTPSAFTPSAFTGPGAFTADEVKQAFSSAQTRSILGASATLGLGNESVVVNSWSNTGSFYVRVSSHGGAYSTAGKFTVTVDQGTTSCASVTDTTITPAASRTASAGAYTTVILTDSSLVRQNAGTTTPAGQALVDKLTTFAGRPDIKGVVVDVASDTRVQQLKGQAQAPSNTGCPFAMNLVAQEIKGIVDAYRLANPALRYVVIAGNDAAIPFFRYPDESLLGQESLYVPPLLNTSVSDASLRRDYVLSQDAYGSSVQISLRTSSYPVPGLAVGRLVETADDIGGLIDAYGTGVLVPQSSLVTGYDFLADVANAVVTELEAGTGNTADKLIAPNNISPQDPASWSAYKLSPGDNRPNLSDKLLGSRHDLVFLAGHFSANDALAADFTTSLLTTDLAGSTTDFKNSIVFSVGCHSGYSIVDADILPNVTQPVDWAQAFARKQAILVAGTGYQYGDTDFIEYSERLYLNFAKQLRAGTSGPVALGEALVKAKLQYLAMTPDIRGLHQKVLLESTLFGLPMLGVNLPASGRTTINAIAPAITPGPVAAGTGGAPLGLMTYDLKDYAPPVQVQPPVTLNTVPPTTPYTATYLSGPDGVTSNPLEPVLPLVAINVTPNNPNLVLRGVGFRGGNYVDTTPILPLTGAPATEIRGVHTQFLAAQFFPMRLWTTNHFPALSGTIGTNLLLTPVQHRAADAVLGTTMRRVHTKLTLRTYFSSNLSQAALSDAPAIVSVDGQFDGSGVAFAVRTVGDPAGGMHEVWVTYTDGGGTWTPFDLTQCVNGACGATNDSQLWKGRLPLAALPANFKYIVQATNGIGLVSYDDKLGGYYTVGTPAATTLTLNAPPSTGAFGENKAVNATLLASGAPVSGKIVTIGIGGAAQVGLTDASGNVSVNVPVQTLPGSYQLTAAFGGDGGFLPASTSGPFAVGKATTNVAWDTSTATPFTTLTASLGGTSTPLLQEAVTYVVSSGAVSKTIVVNTDYSGRAPLPPTGLPVGSYTVAASFAGNATLSGAAATLPALTIAAQTITFNGNASLPGSITVGGAPITFTVSSDANQPVTVGLSPPPPPPNPYCTLTSSGNVYTLTAVAPGTCTVVASAGGTTTSASVTVTQDIAIKANQAITFAALPVKTFGDPDFAINATSSSGLAVAFMASGNCSVAGNTVHITGAGSCTITASQDGNSLYNAATPVPQVLTVNKAAQVITFGALGGKTFGDPAFTVSATGGASGNPVTFAASGNCSVTGATVTITGAGSCTITASQGGNANYNPATDAPQTFAIAKAAQAITFGPLGNKTYGDAPFSVSATASSNLAVTFAVTGSCTISGSTVTITGAGSCTITASQAGNNNYNAAANVAQSFTVAKAAQTITFGALGNKTYGDAPFSVGATASSGLAVTFVATGSCTITGTTVTITAAGNCTITASQAGNASYNAAPDVPQSFTVAKAGQTINFPLISPQPTFVAGGTGTFTVAATGGASGNPVTFSSTTPGVCTTGGTNGTTVTMKSAGICTLTADQASSGNYAAATQAQQSVSIGKASQTITFTGPGNQTLGVPPTNKITLLATATSGLPVSFAATPPAICTVSGATLTMVAAGSCTITASQAGDSNFTAAADVVRTITISSADLPNVWTLLSAKMTTPRLYHTATRFESGPLAGQVLITGGYNQSGTTLKSAELYNPVSRTFVATGTMLTTSAGHTATLLTNGKVIVFGGGNTAVQIFDPTPKTWSSVGTLSTSRSYHTATRLPDGRVLVIGGADNSGSTLSSTILYTPPTGSGNGTFANGPVLDTARELHTATLLPNGKVLVAGGRRKSGSSYVTLGSYQICDASGCTASTSNSIAQRFAHDAVALGPDGSKVLVAGGVNGSADLATTGLYDATAGTWSNAGLGSLTHTRSELTLSPLPNGRALAAGGSNNGNSVKDADAYTPPIAPVAPMKVARAGHTATPLLDASGNMTGILVVGGASGDADEDDALDSAEIYGTP